MPAAEPPDDLADEDEWLAAWEQADRAAGAFLRAHLADHRSAPPPATLATAGLQLRVALRADDPDAAWMRRAAGVAQDLTWPEGGAIADEDLLWQLVATTIALPEDPGLPGEEETSLMALEHVDWLGAIVELVRAGPGAPVDAHALVRYTATCPEIEGEPLDPDDAEVLAVGFEVALRGWRVAGLVDEDDRLTEAGAWSLPRVACFAWETDFDHPDDPDGSEGSEEEAELAELADLYGLDDRGLDALTFLLTILQAAQFGEPEQLDEPAVVTATIGALAEPGVTAAFGAEALGIGRDEEAGDALEQVAELVLRHTRGRAAAPAHLLLARVAEVRGDAAAGQAALDRALELDPDLEPALDDAAWYAEDRGDHARVLTLLRRLGVPPDDPQWVRMQELAGAAPRRVGRNDPCPCGSSRKFKACCLRTGGGIPLADRLRFVLAKLDAYVQRPAQRAHVIGLVLTAARPGEEAIVAMLRDPMLLRLALFDQGILADFVRERGHLLPADETALIEGWSEVRASVCEVVDRTAGESLTLLDLVTGSRTTLRERSASSTLHRGTTLLTHLLPVGDEWQIGTAVTIPEERRSGLVELLAGAPSGEAIARWLGEATRPPELVTSEGDAVEVVELRLRVPDPLAAQALLDDHYEDDSYGSYVVPAANSRSVDATLVLHGELIDLEAGSWPRAARVRDALIDALPGTEVIRIRRRDPYELLADHGGPDLEAAADDVLTPSTLPPELAAALASRIRELEDEWLDEPVPMFGDVTPREAVADPTRREQVQRFLDQMERAPRPAGSAVTMDAARLKRSLGLEG